MSQRNDVDSDQQHQYIVKKACDENKGIHQLWGDIDVIENQISEIALQSMYAIITEN